MAIALRACLMCVWSVSAFMQEDGNTSSVRTLGLSSRRPVAEPAGRSAHAGYRPCWPGAQYYMLSPRLLLCCRPILRSRFLSCSRNSRSLSGSSRI